MTISVNMDIYTLLIHPYFSGMENGDDMTKILGLQALATGSDSLSFDSTSSVNCFVGDAFDSNCSVGCGGTGGTVDVTVIGG